MSSEQQHYWSKVAERYDRVVDLQIGPKTRSLVLERVKQEERLRNLVEFGCGTGYYTAVLASKADSVVATDVSPGMLSLARRQISSANVLFQIEDAQKTSFQNNAFDTAFLSLVIHFTEPEKTLAEMHRILKTGGTLILANLDPLALNVLNRVRCVIRIVYQGVLGYRAKPPKGFGKNVMSEERICELLFTTGFKVLSAETIKDGSRASYIPIEYIRAVKV